MSTALPQLDPLTAIQTSTLSIAGTNNYAHQFTLFSSPSKIPFVRSRQQNGNTTNAMVVLPPIPTHLSMIMMVEGQLFISECEIQSITTSNHSTVNSIYYTPIPENTTININKNNEEINHTRQAYQHPNKNIKNNDHDFAMSRNMNNNHHINKNTNPYPITSHTPQSLLSSNNSSTLQKSSFSHPIITNALVYLSLIRPQDRLTVLKTIIDIELHNQAVLEKNVIADVLTPELYLFTLHDLAFRPSPSFTPPSTTSSALLVRLEQVYILIRLYEAVLTKTECVVQNEFVEKYKQLEVEMQQLTLNLKHSMSDQSQQQQELDDKFKVKLQQLYQWKEQRHLDLANTLLNQCFTINVVPFYTKLHKKTDNNVNDQVNLKDKPAISVLQSIKGQGVKSKIKMNSLAFLDSLTFPQQQPQQQQQQQQQHHHNKPNPSNHSSKTPNTRQNHHTNQDNYHHNSQFNNIENANNNNNYQTHINYTFPTIPYKLVHFSSLNNTPPLAHVSPEGVYRTTEQFVNNQAIIQHTLGQQSCTADCIPFTSSSLFVLNSLYMHAKHNVSLTPFDVVAVPYNPAQDKQGFKFLDQNSKELMKPSDVKNNDTNSNDVKNSDTNSNDVKNNDKNDNDAKNNDKNDNDDKVIANFLPFYTASHLQPSYTIDITFKPPFIITPYPNNNPYNDTNHQNDQQGNSIDQNSQQNYHINPKNNNNNNNNNKMNIQTNQINHLNNDSNVYINTSALHSDIFQFSLPLYSVFEHSNNIPNKNYFPLSIPLTNPILSQQLFHAFQQNIYTHFVNLQSHNNLLPVASNRIYQLDKVTHEPISTQAARTERAYSIRFLENIITKSVTPLILKFKDQLTSNTLQKLSAYIFQLFQFDSPDSGYDLDGQFVQLSLGERNNNSDNGPDLIPVSLAAQKSLQNNNLITTNPSILQHHNTPTIPNTQSSQLLLHPSLRAQNSLSRHITVNNTELNRIAGSGGGSGANNSGGIGKFTRGYIPTHIESFFRNISISRNLSRTIIYQTINQLSKHLSNIELARKHLKKLFERNMCSDANITTTLLILTQLPFYSKQSLSSWLIYQQYRYRIIKFIKILQTQYQYTPNRFPSAIPINKAILDEQKAIFEEQQAQRVKNRTLNRNKNNEINTRASLFLDFFYPEDDFTNLDRYRFDQKRRKMEVLPIIRAWSYENHVVDALKRLKLNQADQQFEIEKMLLDPKHRQYNIANANMNNTTVTATNTNTSNSNPINQPNRDDSIFTNYRKNKNLRKSLINENRIDFLKAIRGTNNYNDKFNYDRILQSESKALSFYLPHGVSPPGNKIINQDYAPHLPCDRFPFPLEFFTYKELLFTLGPKSPIVIDFNLRNQDTIRDKSIDNDNNATTTTATTATTNTNKKTKKMVKEEISKKGKKILRSKPPSRRRKTRMGDTDTSSDITSLSDHTSDDNDDDDEITNQNTTLKNDEIVRKQLLVPITTLQSDPNIDPGTITLEQLGCFFNITPELLQYATREDKAMIVVAKFNELLQTFHPCTCILPHSCDWISITHEAHRYIRQNNTFMENNYLPIPDYAFVSPYDDDNNDIDNYGGLDTGVDGEDDFMENLSNADNNKLLNTKTKIELNTNKVIKGNSTNIKQELNNNKLKMENTNNVLNNPNLFNNNNHPVYPNQPINYNGLNYSDRIPTQIEVELQKQQRQQQQQLPFNANNNNNNNHNPNLFNRNHRPPRIPLLGNHNQRTTISTTSRRDKFTPVNVSHTQIDVQGGSNRFNNNNNMNRNNNNGVGIGFGPRNGPPVNQMAGLYGINQMNQANNNNNARNYNNINNNTNNSYNNNNNNNSGISSNSANTLPYNQHAESLHSISPQPDRNNQNRQNRANVQHQHQQRGLQRNQNQQIAQQHNQPQSETIHPLRTANTNVNHDDDDVDDGFSM